MLDCPDEWVSWLDSAVHRSFGGIAAPDRLKGVESTHCDAGTNALTITTRPDQTQPSMNWSCVRFSKWIPAEPSQMSRSKVSNLAGI